MNFDLGEIILYHSEDGSSAFDVHLKDETVWLTPGPDGGAFSKNETEYKSSLSQYF